MNHISRNSDPTATDDRVRLLNSEKFSKRLWMKDASLWKSDPSSLMLIENSLGWLDIAEKMLEVIDTELKEFVSEIREAGFKYVVHMGMGGSSLAPLVFTRTFANQYDLSVVVLDTTDPTTIQQLEESISVEKTLFIVASKSGSTAEALAFKDYFFEKVQAVRGESAGENFIAITDPGTPLATAAIEQKFRKIFPGPVDIGGRYSALSYFGLVPAALMGVPVQEVWKRALQSARASLNPDYPALILGAALGEMASQKRNKITFLVDKAALSLGMWLEQLLAESTGKEGTGLIPVSDEPAGDPSVYGEDRLFIYITIKNDTFHEGKNSYNENLKKTVAALKNAGQPVLTLEMADLADLGYQFFQWEFATAVAGSILKINPFDQPNVQESKDNTNRLLQEVKELKPEARPQVIDGNLSFYTDIESTSGREILANFFKTAFPGDYIALMAFLPESKMSYERLQGLRKILRNNLKLATTLGYGPRFLHSTGQLHKGGPASGIFLQLTADDLKDIEVPGRGYTFSQFKMAQAEGDLAALRKHGRRVLRIHLGRNLEKGLKELEERLIEVLRSL
jgi:transaldolase/glucose-6-phosphate isomerase